MPVNGFVANQYNTQDTNGFVTYKLEKMTLANGTEVYKINIYNQVTNETTAKIVTEANLNIMVGEINTIFSNLESQIAALTTKNSEQDSSISSLQTQIAELQSQIDSMDLAASAISITSNANLGNATNLQAALNYIANVFAGMQKVTKLTAGQFNAQD